MATGLPLVQMVAMQSTAAVAEVVLVGAQQVAVVAVLFSVLAAGVAVRQVRAMATLVLVAPGEVIVLVVVLLVAPALVEQPGRMELHELTAVVAEVVAAKREQAMRKAVAAAVEEPG